MAAAAAPATLALHHDAARAAVPVTSIATCWLRAQESSKPPELQLISDPFAQRLCGEDPDLGWMESSPHPQAFWVDMMALRTRWLDDALVDVLGTTGAVLTQVVVLGAGLDARPWRLEALRGVAVFEVDFPEVLEAKVMLLEGCEPIATLQAVRANLAVDDWAAKLADAGFSRDKASVWLLEGLIGYLTSEELQELFKRIGGLAAPGSGLLATFTGEGSGHTTSMHRSMWASAPHVERFLSESGWEGQASTYMEVATRYGRTAHIPPESDWQYFLATARR
mmetsp:Transcript_94246/g.270251  ORF Transcript_94246/g.270251 Transcript_94246/m.270251 type:complete len:280 (+) Transcript_94246:90-929(+)